MKMTFSLGGHSSSVVQQPVHVVALVVIFQGCVSGETAQGCVGSKLSLSCPDMKIIEVIGVVLEDSYGAGSVCYIRDNDCAYNASANHTMDVHRRCDGQSSCTVDVIQEKIPCGYLGYWPNNDFERITYNCLDDPQTNLLGIVIACLVCVIVIIVILASVSIVIVRRQTLRQVKSSDAIETSKLETDRMEATHTNEAQGTSLNENAGSSVPICTNEYSTEVDKSLNCGAKNVETPTSEFCELDGVATGRKQSDSEYEGLDHGRNYEPLIVYKQLQ